MSPALAIRDTDRQAIVDIIHRYFWLVDHGRADEAATLFASGGRLIFGALAPKPGTLEGDAITAAMQARSTQANVTTRHITSNIALRRGDEGVIEAYSLLTLYRSDDSSRDTYPASVADVQDVFVCEGSQWCIKQRTISPVFNRGA